MQNPDAEIPSADRPSSGGVCSWSVDLAGDPPVVRVHGEVDRVVVDALRGAIDAAVAATSSAVALDLCDVCFLDSAGVTMLLEVRLQHASRLRLHDLSGWVEHVLELAGLTEVLVDH